VTNLPANVSSFTLFPQSAESKGESMPAACANVNRGAGIVGKRGLDVACVFFVMKQTRHEASRPCV
jgi:hypothetical protein